MFVWRQACPSHLEGHCCIFFKDIPVCFLDMSFITASLVRLRFPSFRAGFWVLLVLRTLNIYEVMYYLLQSCEGYKNILHWQCLWTAFTISSPHHPHIYFLSGAFLQWYCAGPCVGCSQLCPPSPSYSFTPLCPPGNHPSQSELQDEREASAIIWCLRTVRSFTALGMLHSMWAWVQPGIPDWIYLRVYILRLCLS